MFAQTITARRHGVVSVVASLAATLLTASDLHAQAVTPLTLGGAARMAAERSASTAAAQARTSQASARANQRRADLLPQFATIAQYGTRSYNTATLGLDIPTAPGSPPLFDPDGEVRGPIRSIDMRTQVTQRLLDVPSMLRWRAATTDVEAASFSATATAETAAERGATAYLRVMRADARIAARVADSLLAAELVGIAREQVAAGIGIALDVTRAESQLADARAKLIATRSDRDRSMLELRRELALDHSTDVTIADSLAAPPAVEPALDEEATITQALERRADFRAMLASSDRAHGYARAASTEWLPTVSIYADHGSNGATTDNLLSTYSYGVQVSLPAFDGMRRRSRVAEERAREREVVAEAQDARRRVETEVRSALLDISAAREQVTAAKARLVLAEEEVRQARERFRNGLSGNADVITASITLNGARDQMIDALTSYQLAKVELARARGAMATLP